MQQTSSSSQCCLTALVTQVGRELVLYGSNLATWEKSHFGAIILKEHDWLHLQRDGDNVFPKINQLLNPDGVGGLNFKSRAEKFSQDSNFSSRTPFLNFPLACYY